MVAKKLARGKKNSRRSYERRKMNDLLVEFVANNMVSKSYEIHMRTCCNQMHDFGIRSNNISNERVTSWLSSMRGKYSNQTLSHKRAMCLRIWRWGIEHGAVGTSCVPKVFAVRTFKKPTRAFRFEDVTKAFKKLSRENPENFGYFRKTNVSRLLWVKCWFRIAWETGLRHTDIYNLKADDITTSGINIIMEKTKREITRQISEETRGLIDSLLAVSQDNSIFSCHVTANYACTTVGVLLKQVGLPHGSQWLRRSSATHVEKNNPGFGSRHLGHLTPGLAAKYYFDHSQLNEDVPMPPRLDEES